MNKKDIDLSGQIFGKWTVVAFSHYGHNSVKYYKCLCECGTEKLVIGHSLTNGRSKSCGCHKSDLLKQKMRGPDPQLVTPRKIWKARYSDGCSFETFLIVSQQPCYYCGSPPSNLSNSYIDRIKSGRVAKDWFDQCWFKYNGLDRIDPSKSHLEDNIVPCCIKCNQAKNDMTLEEFKIWLNQIYQNFILNNGR